MMRFWYCDAIPLHAEFRCGRQATYRYRPANDPAEPWGYRCPEHESWLDHDFCLTEPITHAEPQ